MGKTGLIRLVSCINTEPQIVMSIPYDKDLGVPFSGPETRTNEFWFYTDEEEQNKEAKK